MKEIILYQSFPKTIETKNQKGLAVLTQGARSSHPGSPQKAVTAGPE